MVKLSPEEIENVLGHLFLEHSPDKATELGYQKLGECLIARLVSAQRHESWVRAINEAMRAKTLLNFFPSRLNGELYYAGQPAEDVITLYTLWQGTLMYLYEHYQGLPASEFKQNHSKEELTGVLGEVTEQLNRYVQQHLTRGYLVIHTRKLLGLTQFFSGAMSALMGDVAFEQFCEEFKRICIVLRQYQFLAQRTKPGLAD